jgi:hypothetical protein
MPFQIYRGRTHDQCKAKNGSIYTCSFLPLFQKCAICENSEPAQETTKHLMWVKKLHYLTREISKPFLKLHSEIIISISLQGMWHWNSCEVLCYVWVSHKVKNSEYRHITNNVEWKLSSLTGRGGLQDSEMLKIPHCLGNQLTYGNNTVSLTYQLGSTPQKHCFSASGTHFR